MDPDTLLARWGFAKNPFRVYVAEREKDTPSIFLEPPYFRDIVGDPKNPYSAILFGERGDGKTTLCRMVEHFLNESTEPLLVIKYTDFLGLREDQIRALTFEQHLERILRLGLEEILRRAEADIEVLRRLDYPSQEVLRWYVTSLFSSGEYRPIEKRLSLLLDRIRGGNRLSKLGGASFRKIVAYLRRKRLELERVSDSQSKVTQLMKSVFILIGPSIPAGTNNPLAFLEGFRNLAASAGFNSIVVLVDKIDENEACSVRVELAAQLVRPIVTSVPYLELDGVATKLFLPYALKDILGNLIRTDRIITRETSWSDEALILLLRKRLRAFSRGKIDSLEPFVDPSLWLDFQKTVLLYSAQSPRNMIRLLDSIISNLCELELEPEMISRDVLDLGTKKFLNLRLGEQDSEEYQRRLDKAVQASESSLDE